MSVAAPCVVASPTPYCNHQVMEFFACVYIAHFTIRPIPHKKLYTTSDPHTSHHLFPLPVHITNATLSFSAEVHLALLCLSIAYGRNVTVSIITICTGKDDSNDCILGSAIASPSVCQQSTPLHAIQTRSASLEPIIVLHRGCNESMSYSLLSWGRRPYNTVWAEAKFKLPFENLWLYAWCRPCRVCRRS